MSDLGMNERAWALADRHAARAYDLRMGVRTLASGARVIDAGVEVPGGLEAGLMLAELCMGGLGHVSYVPLVDRRRALVGRAGLDRSSRGVVHGVAIRRLGDQPRRFLRDGIGAAARQSPRRKGTVRQARIRGRGVARRARARRPHAAD